MALQETVNSCDHFQTEIHFLIDVFLGFFFFLEKSQDIRYFVARSFDWRDIFDCFAIGLI